MSFDTHDEINPSTPANLDPAIVKEDTYIDRFEVSTRGTVSRSPSRSFSAWDDEQKSTNFPPKRKSRDRVAVSYSPDTAANEAQDKRLQDFNNSNPAAFPEQTGPINQNADIPSSTITNKTQESNNMTIDDIVPKEDNVRRPKANQSAREESGQKQVSEREPDIPPELEQFRSAGLDSLFASTNVPVKKPSEDVDSLASDKQTDDSEKPVVKRSQYADITPKQNSRSSSSESASPFEVKGTADNSSINKSGSISTSVSNTKQKLSTSISERLFKQSSRRKVVIVCPTSYNGVKEIADVLKTDNVLALSLYKMNQKDRGRVLDFAFGAASMVDSTVSVEGKQLFIFTKGESLTSNERMFCYEHGLAINMEK